MLHAELARDRRRDEAVGGGDDRAELARLEMPAHQCTRRRQDHGRDARAHEFGMPARELVGRVVGERAQGEAQVFVDVERAGDVLLVVDAVLRLVLRAVDHAPVAHELAPFVVAVAGEQRIVEVEQGQAHAARESNVSLTNY
jgi:hypothetical protein